MVLILKGDNEEQLRQDGVFWSELIRKEKPADTLCRLMIEMGSPQHRLSDLHRSFAEALARSKNVPGSSPHKNQAGNNEHIELQKLDHAALENYLRFGDLGTFDAFFKSSLQPVCEVCCAI